MRVKREVSLTGDSAAALAPAIDQSNFTWCEVFDWLAGEGCCIWNIGDTGYVLTLVNEDNEIEVLLAGGERAKECVPHWEAAMMAHPAHRGMTMVMDGRKGWQRLLPHWSNNDGILSRKVV